MGNDHMQNSAAAALLKECYELATLYARSDAAKDILREKAKRTGEPDPYAAGQADVFPETPMQLASEILRDLSGEAFSAPKGPALPGQYKLERIPPSGEREYLLALMALRNGTGMQQRIDALGHVRVALSYSPDDPRYIALAGVLQEVSE